MKFMNGLVGAAILVSVRVVRRFNSRMFTSIFFCATCKYFWTAYEKKIPIPTHHHHHHHHPPPFFFSSISISTQKINNKSGENVQESTTQKW